MTTFHSILVYLHIAVGTIALFLFWVPVLAKKGGKVHVQAGRIYVFAMYFVAISAFIASIISLLDPVAIRRPGEIFEPAEAAELAQRYRMFSLFLLMLSVLVFASVRHGITALAERKQKGLLAKPAHRLILVILGVLGIAVGFVGIRNGQLLLMIFAGISISASFRMYRDTLNVSIARSDLIVAHLNGLIGSGIGAYTAFFAFGGSRFLGSLLPDQWQVVPWVVPSVVGTIAIFRQSRRYRRRLAST